MRHSIFRCATPPRRLCCCAFRPILTTFHRRARHSRAAWPVPDGWQVGITPSEARLDPGQSTPVTVDITAPDGYAGRQAINVNAYAGQTLVGGVTFYVEGHG